ncbi:MAG: M48 family metallopeptidase [Calditrichia bacterium]
METTLSKKYNRIKLTLALTHIALELIFWLLVIFTGFAEKLAHSASDHFLSPWLQFYYFILGLVLLRMVFNLPLSFYSGYIVEHRFSLSNETLGHWIIDQLKGFLIGMILGGTVITVFYLLLQRFPHHWWVGIWVFLFLFSVLLQRIAPTLLFPIFYKFKPLNDSELKERLEKLAKRWGLHITGIFQFDLSKTTKKANAGFTGMGKSKRVILGDTLLEHFESDEIETIFAHEIGHFVKKHLLKGVVLNSLLSFGGLYLIFYLYSLILQSNHFLAHQLEALPYLILLFFLFSLLTGPLGNIVSRYFEYQADRFAVEATQNIDSFISSLNKLAQLNLADKEPHPVVEFLFYSHPSIKHRIEKLKGANP